MKGSEALKKGELKGSSNVIKYERKKTEHMDQNAEQQMDKYKTK